jgi:hypothetical protein
MRIQLTLVGSLAIAGALLTEQQLQAAPPPARQQTMGRDCNCMPTRVASLLGVAPFAGYPMMPAYNPYYAMPAVPPPPLMQTPAYTATPMQPSPSSQQRSASSSPSYVLPRPQGLAANAGNDAPAEPSVRLRYVELSVTGLENRSDSNLLTTTLDKMKGSRGSSVKHKGGGEATVKVWYSEKDPVDADAVVEAVAKLGFKAAVVGG